MKGRQWGERATLRDFLWGPSSVATPGARRPAEPAPSPPARSRRIIDIIHLDHLPTLGELEQVIRTHLKAAEVGPLGP